MIGATAAGALRYPNFALFWSAQVISGFGDRITVFALAFVTWELTRSAVSTALAVVISTVPFAVFGLFGGAIADAVGRRRAMVACDLIRVVAIASIPPLLIAGAPLPLIYALAFVAAVCSAVFNPARLALVPEIMPTKELGAGNSMVFASDRAVEIVGTLLAGVLVAVMREAAFYVDALTFGLSALLLGRIALDEPAPRTLSWNGLLRDASEGLYVLTQSAVLRANTIVSLLAQLSLPIVNGLTPVLIFREYGLGPEQYGASEAAIAIGAVAAGIASPAVFGGVRKGRLVLAGFASFGAVLVGFGTTPPFWLLLVLFVLVGVTNVIFFVPNMTLIQEVAPPALRGRVFGARLALLNLTWVPVILGAATLAEALTVQSLLAIAGAFTIVVAIIGSIFPSIRDVP